MLDEVSALVLCIQDTFAANVGDYCRCNGKFKVVFVFDRRATFPQGLHVSRIPFL